MFDTSDSYILRVQNSLKTAVLKFVSKIMVLGEKQSICHHMENRAVTTPDTPVYVQSQWDLHLLGVPFSSWDFSLNLCHNSIYVSPHKSQILVNLCLVLNIHYR